MSIMGFKNFITENPGWFFKRYSYVDKIVDSKFLLDQILIERGIMKPWYPCFRYLGMLCNGDYRIITIKINKKKAYEFEEALNLLRVKMKDEKDETYFNHCFHLKTTIERFPHL